MHRALEQDKADALRDLEGSRGHRHRENSLCTVRTVLSV